MIDQTLWQPDSYQVVNQDAIYQTSRWGRRCRVITRVVQRYQNLTFWVSSRKENNRLKRADRMKDVLRKPSWPLLSHRGCWPARDSDIHPPPAIWLSVPDNNMDRVGEHIAAVWTSLTWRGSDTRLRDSRSAQEEGIFTVGKLNTLFGQTINVRRLDLRTITANVRITEI